jgi:hypothetical protein
MGVDLLEILASLGGKAGPGPDLLGRELHQVLVDNVADMLEVGRERDDVDRTPAVLVVELAA